MDIQAIEKAKQQWQTAADLMPQLICLLDGEGRLLHINRTIEWWRLGSVASVKGRELHDILHQGCTDPDCYFQRFWHDITPARLEGRRVAWEVFDPLLGQYFSIRVQPLLWRHRTQARTAEDMHAIVIVDDISDLKQAEAGIQRRNAELVQQVAYEAERRALSEEMQARLLAILEKTSDYVAMSDAEGSMLYLNPAGRALLGLAPGDDISRLRLCEHSDQDVQDRIRDEAIPSAIRSGLWTGETRLRNHADREIHASQVIIAHRGEGGLVENLSTIIRDITEQVQTAQALRESRDELRRLSGLLVTIQEDERRRIALDLHDGLGQSLSLIKLSIENAARMLAAGASDEAGESLQQLIPRVRETLVEVRRVATELRPSILDDLGILPTLTWFFREFETACGDIAVEKIFNIAESDVPAALHITLYRILQEATSNIVKHSGATRVRVSLNRANEVLHLLIEDNGCGIDPASIGRCVDGQSRGIGLLSMKERALLYGGSFHIESSPGQGTCIKVLWPCGQASS